MAQGQGTNGTRAGNKRHKGSQDKAQKAQGQRRKGTRTGNRGGSRKKVFMFKLMLSALE